MSLISISTQILNRGFAFSRGFSLPRRRLLLTYLIAMISILGISEVSLYFFLIGNLNQQLNRELLTLVQAAAPSLDRVKSEGIQSLDREIPWRDLFSNQDYSLEWYDSEGTLLARKGTNLPLPPLFQTLSPEKLTENSPVFQRQGQIQTATISVYAKNPDETSLMLEGYIRAGESTQEMELILNKLRLGLGLGGTTALILVSISSIYITQEALSPMEQGVYTLRKLTSDVSHQLRTPLTRISIATEILLSKTDQIQPDEARKLSIINTAVDQIKCLVEELLFLIRIDMTSNLRELEFSRVSLKPLLKTLEEKFQVIAQRKGIDFQTHLLSKVFVRGDTVRLTRLFTNLLENSFNYTDSGGSVFLSMKLSGGNVIVSIRDTGMGIAAEDGSYIFQGFWRSESAKIRQSEGFGLGLTIAHAIAQQHQGKITVTSEIGVGSCFQVHLPLV